MTDLMSYGRPMYHVMANLEERFASLEDALHWCKYDAVLYPRIPDSRLFCEDFYTARI